jgi:hypothetical protein
MSFLSMSINAAQSNNPIAVTGFIEAQLVENVSGARLLAILDKVAIDEVARTTTASQ